MGAVKHGSDYQIKVAAKRESRVGLKFGRLTITGIVLVKKEGRNLYLFETLCDCGKHGTPLMFNALKNGNSKSCGCLQVDLMKKAFRKREHTDKRTYLSWQNMVARCSNSKLPFYKNYGGRGVRVCDRWKKYENFLEDMGVRPEETSIDRINGDLGYFKDNCQWADRKTQNRNIRRKIDWAQAMTILTVKNMSNKKLAEHYGICKSYVSKIRLGKYEHIFQIKDTELAKELAHGELPNTPI